MLFGNLMMAMAVLGAPVSGPSTSEDAAPLAEEVRALGRKGEYAAAAAKAADGAGREVFDVGSRVLLGGLARENYEKSFQKGRDLHDLCELAKVMRLVASLASDDSPAARQQMVDAAEGAEARLQEAMGNDWSGFCVEQTETEEASPLMPVARSQGVRDKGKVVPKTPAARVPKGPDEDASRVERRRVRAGAATLTVGASLLASMIGVLVYRRDGEADLGELRVAAAGRDETTGEQALAESLAQRYQSTAIAAAVLGATGTALVVTGVVLLATRRSRPTRMSLAPWGTRGAGGIVFSGRF